MLAARTGLSPVEEPLRRLDDLSGTSAGWSTPPPSSAGGARSAFAFRHALTREAIAGRLAETGLSEADRDLDLLAAASKAAWR